MMKRFLYLIALVVVLGCETAPPIVEITADYYAKEGLALLKEPTDDAFWKLINAQMANYQDETAALLESFADKQIGIIKHYAAQDNVFRILFHLKNLEYIPSVSRDQMEDLKAEIASELSPDASTLFRRSLPDSGYAEIPKTSDLVDVTQFSSVLAEINVLRNYKTPEDIERVSYPTFSGSGFVVDESHIVTAFHVVERVFRSNTASYEIFVVIDGKKHENVSIKAWDSLSDLALLELESPVEIPFPVFELIADSDDLLQGSEIYTYGHHYGFNTTLTKGIISALRRRAPEVGYWLQIDATVAPGASGGPVIGTDNKIYGVVVAGITFEDINFAIPSETLLDAYPALISGYSINRPWIGLMLSSEDDDEPGVRIKSILPTSPLKSSTLLAGDRLLSINGTAVTSVEQAQEVLTQCEAGNIVHITATNDIDGGETKLWLKLPKRPDYAIYNTNYLFDRFATLYPYFGISVNPERVKKQQLSTRSGTTDLYLYEVTAVDSESYLHSRGVRSMDSVGFLSDYFEGRKRIIEILHIPHNLEIGEMRDIRDYIFTLRKGEFDEDIL